MAVVVIGEPNAADALAAAVREAGLEAEAAAPFGSERGAIAALADELTHLDGILAERTPAAVLLADSGDAALAGALAATKRLVPVGAVSPADESEPDATNGRLLAEVADRVLPSDPAAIAAWARAASTDPAPRGG